ncbi:MAG: class A beta-lactamase-related serine hydrolase, partial [Chloroflexota bacterium]|nr:class A beta-lactamase-related serine hydrolase [Chloroflexota bacterium]
WAVAARGIGPGWADGPAGEWSARGDASFPAASTVKVAILVALGREIDAGRVVLDQSRPPHPADRVGGSGVLAEMSPDLALAVADLAYLMITISDNTASNALIRLVGLPAVNEHLDDLGLTGIHLGRPFLGRLPQPDEGENTVTANGLADLLTLIATDRAASPATCAWMRGMMTRQQHRDRLGRDLPPGVGFGGKSGSLPGIAHDAALLDGPGGTVAVVVLTEGVQDSHAADAAIGQIGRAAGNLVR